MSDRTDRPGRRTRLQEGSEPSGWNGGTFVTGLLLGAAVGAGLALLFAPRSGSRTRRLVRRRARAVAHDATVGWVSAREHTRRLLREKKEALRDRIDQGLERIDDLRGS
jgi:gas vesicle protein